MTILNKNDEYTADITGYTSEGAGVCHIDGRAVFVPGTLAGERWQLRLVKVTAAAVWAKGEVCLSPSPRRTVPACPVYGRCGGCQLLHMAYEEELRMKLARVNAAFRRIGGLSLEAERILPADAVTGYRNKAVYNVGGSEKAPVCGFFRAGTHDIVPLEHCLLQTETADAATGAVLSWMGAHHIAPYDEKTGHGMVRRVFTRTARSGAAVCCVVAARGFGQDTESLAPALRAVCPALSGVVLNINKTAGNTVLAGDFYTLWGSPDLSDTLCGRTFRIAPQAFYQVNPPQAEKLYGLAVGMAAPEGTGTVLDLYCGAGTITLALAAKAARVIGAEIVPEAVENARENAARNGVTNAEFLCADAGEAAQELTRRGLRPDAVVVDPPRKGMSPEAVAAVCAMDPRRVVYVSCDPATLARDLKRFSGTGYAPTRAVAVDMFPRTSHVETVVLMSRVKD